MNGCFSIIFTLCGSNCAGMEKGFLKIVLKSLLLKLW